MVRNICKKEDFKEIEPLYLKKGVRYYMLRVDRCDIGEGMVSFIEEVYDHEPVDEDKESLYNAWLSMAKKVKVKDIERYDVSDSVNVFEINGMKAWLDKATRVGLKNSLNVEKDAGHENTTLYLNGIILRLPVDTALNMLDELELYAIDCYLRTEEHKAEVEGLNVIEDVESYDYTTGYPSHPIFEYN